MTRSWRSRSAAATERIGEAFGRAAGSAGLTIGLDGPLGSGKTQFARGFVRGVDPRYDDWVSSPTYAICNTYPTEPPTHHLDLYRLADEDDLEGIGFYELEAGHRLIEWMERVGAAARTADIAILFDRPSERVRVLRAQALTESGIAVLQAVAAAEAAT